LLSLARNLQKHYALGQRLLDEVSPNAGSSMRDAVDRIEARVETVDERTAHMSAIQTAQIDGATHGIVFADLDGKLVKANRTYRRWVGKETEELLGDGWMQAISPADLIPLRSGWADAVERQIDYLPPLPITCLGPDGKPFSARVTARIIRERGKPLFYWCEIWRVE
jgi:PAS domain S-box-containing protein